MSIINDALKKVEKQKHIFSKVKEINPDRFNLKRWLIWIGTGLLCFLGFTFVAGLLDNPEELKSIQKTALQPESPDSSFHFRKIDIETPLKSPSFQLNGILYDEKRPLAIINNRIVGEGSLIEGARLLQIRPDQVTVIDRGKELTLRIK